MMGASQSWAVTPLRRIVLSFEISLEHTRWGLTDGQITQNKPTIELRAHYTVKIDKDAS